MVYVDTSVLAAYYLPERLSDKSESALSAHSERIISPLVELELISALAMRLRVRELDAAGCELVLSKYNTNMLARMYRKVEIGPREFTVAGKWLESFSTPLRAPDALHLAAAFNHHATLLTADRILARAATQLGVENQLIS